MRHLAAVRAGTGPLPALVDNVVLAHPAPDADLDDVRSQPFGDGWQAGPGPAGRAAAHAGIAW